MRVILAEDEQRAMRGLRTLLQTLHREIEIVGEASDGAQGLELIRTLQPDVVFTDIRMQPMDGLSMIRAVRALGMDTKFVILSAYEEFDYARQALLLGVVDYLVKPVTEQELQEVLDRLHVAGNAGTGPAGDENASRQRLRDRFSQAHPVVQNALDMIEDGYARKISQKEAAEELGVTAEYFSYLFSRDVKETFSRFVRRYRIEKAKELVDAGEKRADVLAAAVGFSDIKYFYKCFKEETGQNLSEYRKM